MGAAICLTVFVVAFACASVIEYSPLGTLLRPGLSPWLPNERFNRVTGKMMAVVVVMGWPLCGLSGLQAGQPLGTSGSPLRAGLSFSGDFGCEP
jgi:hypothetical protein